MKCKECGKTYKVCVKHCPDCFDYSGNNIGPLFDMGVATADKAWANSPCPLENIIREAWKVETSYEDAYSFLKWLQRELMKLWILPGADGQ